MSADTVLVYISCPPDKAERLAEILVEARAAACVSILPAVTSIYRWKEAVQKDGESLLIAKTAAARFEDLRQLALKHHPYELPEIIGVKLAEGHAPYLHWIHECTA